jgi:alpha-tubulin suppressor-like RCC1 family protein
MRNIFAIYCYKDIIMKSSKLIFGFLLVLAGCAGNTNSSNNPNNPSLPSVSIEPGNYIQRAKAEFDVTTSQDGSASLQLVKKSYASGGSCSHGTCVDYTDVTVTNTTQTAFALNQTNTPGNAFSTTTLNGNLTNFLTLNIATLFDNDLFACGGTKCTTAVIRVYTTSVNAGPGLYNVVANQSIPLYVTGGTLSTATNVPYNSTTGQVVDSQPIIASQQVVSLANSFFNSSNYVFTANLATAAAGTFKAHIVVEYDLASSGGFFTAPIVLAPKQIVTASSGVTYALMGDGTVKSVGQNNWGQLGNGTISASNSTPSLVSGFFGATSISVSDYGACAIMSDGSVKCTGDDNSGPFGDGGSPSTESTPITVSAYNHAKTILMGTQNTMAIMSDNTVSAAGYNSNGQIGDGTANVVTTPKTITGWGTVSQIAQGQNFTCAITLANGSVECTGNNSSGEFGNGGTANVTTPVVISNWGTGVKFINANGSNLCAILSDNSVKCAGDNGYDQLGTSSITQSTTPLAITGFNGSSYVGVGVTYICSLNTGVVKCVGSNYSSGWGDGTAASSYLTPVTVANWNGATQLSVGWGYICATMSDGTFRCQGDNSSGELGNGSNVNSSLPITPLF